MFFFVLKYVLKKTFNRFKFVQQFYRSLQKKKLEKECTLVLSKNTSSSFFSVTMYDRLSDCPFQQTSQPSHGAKNILIDNFQLKNSKLAYVIALLCLIVHRNICNKVVHNKFRYCLSSRQANKLCYGNNTSKQKKYK